jgi:hypothetical protein
VAPQPVSFSIVQYVGRLDGPAAHEYLQCFLSPWHDPVWAALGGLRRSARCVLTEEDVCALLDIAVHECSRGGSLLMPAKVNCDSAWANRRAGRSAQNGQITWNLTSFRIFLKERIDLVILASIWSLDKMWTIYPA